MCAGDREVERYRSDVFPDSVNETRLAIIYIDQMGEYTQEN